MKLSDINVRHYNRKGERIDILSEESSEKIEKIVVKVINRIIGR